MGGGGGGGVVGVLGRTKPPPPPVSTVTNIRLAGLAAIFFCVVGGWTSRPLAEQWPKRLHEGGQCRPTGVARALANAPTLLRYAMGEGPVAIVGPCLHLVSRMLAKAGLTPHNKGVSPDIVVRARESPACHRMVLEVVLAPMTNEQALLDGHTLRPTGEAPLVALPARGGREGRLRALEALFPARGQAMCEPPLEEPAHLRERHLNPDMDLDVRANEGNKYLLS